MTRKTKTALIAALACLALVGGFVLMTMRSESPEKNPQPVATNSKPKASSPEAKRSYGGTYRIEKVTIASSKQPQLKPQPTATK